MKFLAKNAARPWGFTLIELLTVVAIIAVLATLLASGLSAAKRKARQSLSISNLRQISLALNLYQDDHRKRPSSYALMVREKYLTQHALLCAEDKLTGNWAGLIEDPVQDFLRAPSTDGGSESLPEVPHSYFKAFDSPDEIWDKIEKNPLAGIAACQLHGIGRQSPDSAPSLTAYQGLVLRGLKDTSVISRQVFWSSTSGDKGPPAFSAPVGTSSSPTPSDLPLFLDGGPGL